jgi:hypothetical protein
MGRKLLVMDEDGGMGREQRQPDLHMGRYLDDCREGEGEVQPGREQRMVPWPAVLYLLPGGSGNGEERGRGRDPRRRRRERRKERGERGEGG